MHFISPHGSLPTVNPISVSAVWLGRGLLPRSFPIDKFTHVAATSKIVELWLQVHSATFVCQCTCDECLKRIFNHDDAPWKGFSVALPDNELVQLRIASCIG